MATLIVTHGPASGQVFALGEHRIVLIGRDQECTFQILDPQMSRRHLQIKNNQDGSHAVRDFHSANGVLVNGGKIDDESPLSDGDEIVAGETCIVYAAVDSPDAMTVNSLLRKRGEHLKGTLLEKPDQKSG